MPLPEPPRIAAFRDRMIRQLPRAPMDRTSEAEMRAMPMRCLMLAFLTWRMRFVPAQPRAVSFWSSAVSPARFRTLRPEIKALLDDVEAGADLTSRLSDSVNKKGIILPGANPNDRGKDIDAVLIRMGLHHFHVGTPGPGNPMGRSDTLVFAEVLEREFRIVAISGHAVFRRSSPEHRAFTELCTAYVTRDIAPGQGFLLNPIMSSGHAILATVFADTCEDRMTGLEPTLNDPATVDALYSCQIEDGAAPIISRPRAPSLMWHFHDVRFGLLDQKTGLFFSLLSYLDR